MNCEDFERLWQARLDAGTSLDAETERELERHGAACAACRALASGYALLSQAIGSLRPVPAPQGFAERCYAAALQAPARVDRSAVWHRSRWVIGLAAAASLLAALLLGVRGTGSAPREAVVKAPPSPLLTDALADATSATWDLALEASEPAARVGRGVLGTAVETGPADRARFFGSSPVDAASDALEALGERVSAGVEPLSGSAKHAFGFLLGPALDDVRENPRPS